MGNAHYQVIITMKPKTVTALVDGNYKLYGFKAVRDSDKAGRPLVWFKKETYSASTYVDWHARYQAYTSSSKIVPNRQIKVGFSADINRGQMLKVEAGGVGTVVGGGPATAISIENTAKTQFTCGISEATAGGPKPLCVFPLYGMGLDVITPLQKLLLMFSTKRMMAGDVINYIYGAHTLATYTPGIFIDLTGANRRDVDFDINKGWSWGGFAWAKQIEATECLVPLLIEG